MSLGVLCFFLLPHQFSVVRKTIKIPLCIALNTQCSSELQKPECNILSDMFCVWAKHM